MKRALFLMGGTMKGAYLVGVMKVFYEELGNSYFDSIYSRSVGVFEQVFFATRQPETMEKTWREYVNGNQLIKPANLFRGKPVIDLDYLVKIFKSEKSFLNINHLVNSPTNLFTFVTNMKTNSLVVLDLKKENVFDAMRATCALPILYPPVEIRGKKYIDGAMSDRKKWEKVIIDLSEKYDELIIVINKKRNKGIVPNHPKIKILSPSKMPLRNALDTNKKRIIKTINQGKKDAKNFLKIYKR